MLYPRRRSFVIVASDPASEPLLRERRKTPLFILPFDLTPGWGYNNPYKKPGGCGMKKDVSAAVIEDGRGRILICRRREGGSCAHLWEFAGGKREEGETDEECLIRECREELDVEITVGGLLLETFHRYPEYDVDIKFFSATIVSGEPKLIVHETFCWAGPEDFDGLEFCPADREILKLLSAKQG